MKREMQSLPNPQMAAMSYPRNRDRDSLSDTMLHLHIDCAGPQTNAGGCAPHFPGRSARSLENGNRRTGEFLVSRGSANGSEIIEGSRGGLKYVNGNGNWTYLPRK